MQSDTLSSGGSPGKRHVVGIAAELRDVLLDPLERSALVEQSIVASGTLRILRGERRVREKTKRAKTVVWRDHNHSSRLRQPPAVAASEVGGCTDEPSSVQPDDDRRESRGRWIADPDVELQAVFVSTKCWRTDYR